MRELQRTVVIIEEDDDIQERTQTTAKPTAKDVLKALLTDGSRTMTEVQHYFGISRTQAELVVRLARQPKLAQLVIDGSLTLRAAETQLSKPSQRVPVALIKGVSQVSSPDFQAGLRCCISWLTEDGYITPEVEERILSALPTK